MLNSDIVRGLLLGTALTLPMAAAGQEQRLTINPEQLEGKSAECRQLAELVQERQEPIGAAPSEEIATAINSDDRQACEALRMQIASASPEEEGADTATARESETAEESERVSETVELSEEATIEGEAVVSVPQPDVDVQVPPPNVRVIEQQPRIDITQPPAEIDLQQERPRIAVEIPEIIVRVDIPAPTIYVLRQDPEVVVSQDDPQVEVQQGEPQVRVTQADPNLNIDLGVDPGAQETEATGTETAGADEETTGQQQVAGDTNISGGEPQVEITEAEGQPVMSYQGGEPTLSYESVEPEISVQMAEQPQVELQQSGEATVVLETPEEREQRRQQRQAQNAEGGNAATGTGAETMMVGDLMNMEVVTADGEELGAPVAFVEVDGQPNLVLEDGGFLGMGGKEVSVRMSRVAVQDEQLVLEDMTEEDIEAASAFNFDASRSLPRNEQIGVGG